MIEEAIKKIETLATKARGLTEHQNPREPWHVYTQVHPDGSVHKVHAEPKPRVWKCGSLDALAVAGGYFADKDKAVTFFVADDAAYAVVDDADDRSGAFVALPLSEQFALMLSGRLTGVTQAQLVTTLRTVIGRDSLEPVGVLAKLEKLRFTSQDDGVSEVKHAKASVDRDLLVEVKGEGDGDTLPEDIAMAIPVFNPSVFDCRLRLDCSLIVDPSDRTFTLRPKPHELEICRERAVREAAGVLVKSREGARVLTGVRPNPDGTDWPE